MKVAVIPARGGSKRIPRKNIRPFCRQADHRATRSRRRRRAGASTAIDRVHRRRRDRRCRAAPRRRGAVRAGRRNCPTTTPARCRCVHACAALAAGRGRARRTSPAACTRPRRSSAADALQQRPAGCCSTPTAATSSR
ncbi:MAG: hypothetical protein MZW92_10690 [Comamonadaceae bacterium]|nr:hypothetical protein [Comamonadaceae bacterium]